MIFIEMPAQKANSHHSSGAMPVSEIFNQFVCGIYESQFDTVTKYHASCAKRAASGLDIQPGHQKGVFRCVPSSA